MSNIDKQALREAAATAKIAGEAPVMPFDQRITALNDFMKQCTPATVLALLDELEAAEKRTVKMPAFDGYVPHVARELQAGFRIACDRAGINIAAAGKGE